MSEVVEAALVSEAAGDGVEGARRHRGGRRVHVAEVVDSHAGDTAAAQSRRQAAATSAGRQGRAPPPLEKM